VCLEGSRIPIAKLELMAKAKPIYLSTAPPSQRLRPCVSSIANHTLYLMLQHATYFSSSIIL
jgi:hypothetical protein